MIIIPWSEPSLSSPQLQWFRDVIHGSLCVCRQTFFISSLEIASRETWKSGYVFFHGWTGVRMQKLMLLCISLHSRQLTSLLSHPWLQSQYAMKDSSWHRSGVPWANIIHPASPDKLWLLWWLSLPQGFFQSLVYKWSKLIASRHWGPFAPGWVLHWDAAEHIIHRMKPLLILTHIFPPHGYSSRIPSKARHSNAKIIRFLQSVSVLWLPRTPGTLWANVFI